MFVTRHALNAQYVLVSVSIISQIEFNFSIEL